MTGLAFFDLAKLQISRAKEHGVAGARLYSIISPFA